MGNIYERLDKILPTIKEKEFQEKRGLGNEVGFHIFDYEPKYELLVREYIEDLKEKINKKSSDIYIREFDLYEIIIKIIEDKGYLEKLFKMEKEKGTDKLVKPIKSTLRFTQKNDLIVDYFKKM
ncbi:BREX protein BrxB domain-containing protein [Anaerosalibacter bizertensis]|uniref:BREX protein BrxB domain-containing protein n=1 Tax=Anaerosalibacter bizertensis TaxID=932217 RepID=UPI00227B768F|nr:BREX protein BrxB domain-containing protein [Anaerosalibacter bizertensis]